MTTFRNASANATDTTSGASRRQLGATVWPARRQLKVQTAEEQAWRRSILLALNLSLETRTDIVATTFLDGRRWKTVVEAIVAATNEEQAAELSAVIEETNTTTPFCSQVFEVLVEDDDYIIASAERDAT